MYFVNETHENNYKKVLLKWKNAKSNTEYQSACYILSVPMIFEKVERYLFEFKTPVDWIWRWEYKYTLSKLPEYQEEDEQEETPEIPYDLTGSMVQLGKFALNMWNGYENFNLLNCMSSLDGDNYRVLRCCMDIRLGKYRDQ